MGQGGYKIRDKEGIHFVTFAVTEWVDVFTRKDYCDILLDSISALVRVFTNHSQKI